VLTRFTGASQHTLDDKGRINMPVRIKEILAKQYDDRLVVTLSARAPFKVVDRCLHIYPASVFEKLLEHIETLPQTDRGVAAFVRKVVNNAEECPMDRQGRVLLPPRLRELVGVQDKVYLVGSGNVLELWNESDYEKSQQVDDILVEEQTNLSQNHKL
jgi:MraZ protein